MNDTELFQFESDFVETLRCIPMAVRFKLDLVGVKVSLRQWSRFTLEERADLLAAPCTSTSDIETYRDQLVDLIALRTGEAPKSLPPDSTVPWNEAKRTPNAVRIFAGTVNATAPSDLEWSKLSPLKRFVLLKLSRDNHDNVNFIPALQEFGLLGGPAYVSSCRSSMSRS